MNHLIVNGHEVTACSLCVKFSYGDGPPLGPLSQSHVIRDLNCLD